MVEVAGLCNGYSQTVEAGTIDELGVSQCAKLEIAGVDGEIIDGTALVI